MLQMKQKRIGECSRAARRFLKWGTNFTTREKRANFWQVSLTFSVINAPAGSRSTIHYGQTNFSGSRKQLLLQADRELDREADKSKEVEKYVEGTHMLVALLSGSPRRMSQMLGLRCSNVVQSHNAILYSHPEGGSTVNFPGWE
jgi:hypothetical protein